MIYETFLDGPQPGRLQLIESENAFPSDGMKNPWKINLVLLW